MKNLIILFALSYMSSGFACDIIEQPPYDPSSYYSSAMGLDGDSLKSALNTIIRDHQDYSYTPCVWDILEITDEDPNDPNSIIAFYTQRSILKANRDQGGNTPDFWNREHIWPRSHGFPSNSQHAHNDVHALRPTDKSVNEDRADDDFATGGSPDFECTLCNEGPGTWEPPPLVKGDTARMMFYMDVRYEGGDDSGVADLELVDALTSSGQNIMGILCDLVQWHIDDPVSAEEIERNNIIYTWQGNRNPFIDHPEFVVPIWGQECGIEVASVSVNQPMWYYIILIVSVFVAAMAIKRRVSQ